MKKNIAVVAGGYSGEYNISLRSARVVVSNLPTEKYNLFLILITKEKWVYIDDNEHENSVDKNDFSIIVSGNKIKFDCVFNIIHGTPGEDGKLLGYFDMLGIPYTSSSHAVSAITFNKAFCSQLVRSFEIGVPKSIHIFKHDEIHYAKIIEEITLPCFVKACNSGSSVGAFKAKTTEELETAVKEAFEIDSEIVVEEYINGTEITCGVFRYKNQMIVFPLTEIVSLNDFFDYDAKYSPNKAREITPARIKTEEEILCKSTSVYIYNKLNCKGVVRIDYILTKSKKMYFIEVNAVPGMSEASIIPKQAAVFGYTTQQLFEMMIENVIG